MHVCMYVLCMSMYAYIYEMHVHACMCIACNMVLCVIIVFNYYHKLSINLSEELICRVGVLFIQQVAFCL